VAPHTRVCGEVRHGEDRAPPETGTAAPAPTERHGLAPAEIWAALDGTKQATAHIIAPLLKARLAKRIGTRKPSLYVLDQIKASINTRKPRDESL
jgi:hypothetical protein